MPEGSLAATQPDPRTSLLDLVDGLLDQGVVLVGNATISVAGVDLTYLGLSLVLSSVETLRRRESEQPPARPTAALAVPSKERPTAAREGGAGAARTASAPDAPSAILADVEQDLDRLRGVLPERVAVDPEGVEQGLAKLVLTLIEFLRKLLERQAVRRMEGGSLTDEEIEQMGLALMRLEAKVREMAALFGLGPEDLNLELGPLGELN